MPNSRNRRASGPKSPEWDISIVQGLVVGHCNNLSKLSPEFEKLAEFTLAELAHWKSKPHFRAHPLRMAYHIHYLEPKNHDLFFGVLNHDIGKSHLEKKLTESNNLTAEEIDEIKARHWKEGYDVLKLNFPKFPLLAAAAGMHHSYGVDERQLKRDFEEKGAKVDLNKVRDVATKTAILDFFDAFMSRTTIPKGGVVLDVRKKLHEDYPTHKEFTDALLASPYNKFLYEKKFLEKLGASLK